MSISCLWSARLQALDVPATQPAAFQIGADISSLPQVEAGGGVFKDLNGKPADLLAILKAHGITDVRLRIWNEPRNGYCGLEQTLAMAKRVKAAGLGLLVDFHYADSWADPRHQPKPRAWKDLHGAELENAVYSYTHDVIAALDQQQTPPDVAQTGNEITNGFLWDDGKLGGDPKQGDERWKRFAGLLKAAIRGVNDGRDGKTPIRVMVHIDRGGDNAGCRWFFDHLRAQQVNFDVIGLSYYPWWQGALEKLRANLDDLSVRYQKDLVVVETGYPSSPKAIDARWHWTADPFPPSPEGQRAFLAALVKIIRATPGGRGKGVYYWEPAWIPTPADRSLWTNRGLFDSNGQITGAIQGFTGR